VFEEEAKKIGGAEFLAQGTLYPDVIESVSFTGGPSVTIKSHHNVGGLPERMNMKLVEPLRELFKDEVRALGRELGSARCVRRPPSVPGAGPRDPHSGRGHDRGSSTSCARRTRSISRRSATPASMTRSGRPSRCCCRCKTVGVMGDGRTYDSVCGLRAVTSTDGMTADVLSLRCDAFLGAGGDTDRQRGEGRQPRGL
jgi:GMP synthase (glutamine-hydrolysing)